MVAAAYTQDVDPPVWPDHFTEAFVESYNYTHIKVAGKMFYDHGRNLLRVDRTDGKF